MKFVFDTNVLVSATIWENSKAQKLLFALLHANATIYCSVEIISEYKKVLKRDFEYSDEETALILKKVMEVLTFVEPREEVSVIQDDPEDNKIIECALAANAEHIVSYDSHLLKLKDYRGVKIILPKEVYNLNKK